MARNGPEFEKMTMEKQKDNPKFSFLFGGEFYSYYKCKLALEQQQREFSPALGPPLPGDSFLRLQFVLCHRPPSVGPHAQFPKMGQLGLHAPLRPCTERLLGPSVIENAVIDPLPGLRVRGFSVVLQM